jgi:hypothetical protein
MGNDFEAANGQDGWDRVAAELRACRESQQKAYGDIDSTTLGRYLAGESAPDEAARVQAALKELPELQSLADIVSDVLGGLPPVSEAPPAVAEPAPRVLPFKPAAPRKPVSAFWYRHAAALAAACLLLVVGGGTLLFQNRPATEARTELADRSDGFASRGGAAPMLASLDLGPGLTLEDDREKEDFLPAPPPRGEKKLMGGGYLKGAVRTPGGPRTVGVQDPAAHSLVLLTAEADPKRVAAARKEVVRPLVKELRRANDTRKGREIAVALGRLGPASTEAATDLVARWVNSTDPQERKAALEALKKLGPAARDALPRLTEAVCAGKFHSKDCHDRVQQLVDSMNTRRHWQVGVYDPAGKASVRAARKTNLALRQLVEKHGVAVFVEVRHASHACPHMRPTERLKGMGPNAVVVVLDVGRKAVEVYPTEAVCKCVSPEKTKLAIKAALTKDGCDGAISATYDSLASALVK